MKRKIVFISGGIILLFGLLIMLNTIAESKSNSDKVFKKTKSSVEGNSTLKKEKSEPKADSPDIHALIQKEKRTKSGDKEPDYRENQVMEEFMKAKERLTESNARTNAIDFIERGPGNVAGRTRALLIDPDDATNQTWYAGSASGGIWKTSNGGDDWSYISGDILNLGTNTLAMSPANTQVIYAGTGEHFTIDIDGAGMFKSTDKGVTWSQIADPSTYPDFKNVSRIIVDPNNSDVVVATTRNSLWSDGVLQAAIYKTIDGGGSWTQVRSSTNERYDDLDFDPANFNTMYVAIDEVGVIKSLDAGDTWSDASEGLIPTGRVEITVSPVNSNRLWASVDGGLSGNSSDLYVTSDAANTWSLVVNPSGIVNEDFLGGQGFYDNIITPHPFDEDAVYAGGVNLWKFTLTGNAASDIRALETMENGSEQFITYVNSGGAYLAGGLNVGTVPFSQLLPVEIRFGEGTQKAHRFTVGGLGSGVPSSDYFYQDYVDVPFQVWDVENNVQLMASFRDQQEDGAWNLIESLTDGDEAAQSREYLYVHKTTYSETPSTGIAVDGGIDDEQMYFFWPVLSEGETFDPENLPISNLEVSFSTIQRMEKITTNISDAYGDFDGLNAYLQLSREEGMHPDQHNIVTFDEDAISGTFRLMISNDGGVYTSLSSINPGSEEGDFEYVSYGYNTTQFYGADKAPREDRYIGGMQDNGTWYHPSGTTAGAEVDATFFISGDGFEALWHSADVNKFLGGSQFNNFFKTEDGGETVVNASGGFTDDGPFRTRLAHHKSLPDRVFTVGVRGVWKSTTFGGAWVLSEMNSSDLWSFNNSADVEVSYANPDVIWAGGRLEASQRLFVSNDGGETFNPSENYTPDELGFVSGIGTHPSDDQVAYALFSFSGSPKVIKTDDLGATWADISGFDGSGDRGFPDVAVNCLFVFPDNTDRIWVGSEIGIIESLDGGASWNLLDSNLPAVNINDFKLVENQLVLATYGRGIWSVELDGVLIPPIVKNAFVSPNSRLDVNMSYALAFDSTLVFIDGQLVATFYANEIGDVIENIQNSGLEGTFSIQAKSYLDGTVSNSPQIDIFVYQTNDPVESYGTDFSDATEDFVANATGDIIGDGFTIKGGSGFSDTSIQSPHPYPDNSNLYFYLRTPVIVMGADATFEYEDVAMIEPGEEGTVFGDLEFWDYVIVEATSDGLNWVALEDGYDARLHDNWNEAYTTETGIKPDLYQPHSINLLDHFSADDRIFVRFRMFCDANTNGFGWVIDNLYIQGELIASLAIQDEKSGLFIYPNPIYNETTISMDGPVDNNEINVYDLQGKLVEQIVTTAGQKLLKWSPSNLKNGLYILRYRSMNAGYSKKVLIQ